MKLSLVVPCYNEAENVHAFQEATIAAFEGCDYDYEIDNNGSLDELRAKAVEFLDLIFKKN